ncbi:MAG TPA: CoA protein activase [Cyanobacteria bacterium UBA11991]|nr:CoA protein activase [Cyanobacteria bacterium UBA11991]
MTKKEKEQNKKIKVSFPHMGTVSYAWAATLRIIGCEPYIEPYTSKKTLSLGTKHSPEAICIPYKLILGNFIEAIEGGTDYVAMITSPGCCRLGEYGNCIENALRDMGYHTKYVEMRLYDGIKGMYDFLKKVSGKNNPLLFSRAIMVAIMKAFMLDDLETMLSYYRAREIHTDDAEKNYKVCLKLIDGCDTLSGLRKVKKEIKQEMAKTKIDPKRDVLNVDITGEIYVVNDEFSNQGIERELGRMGVQVRRSLTLSSFLKDAIIPKIFRKGETHLQRAFRLAKPYLMRDIGGDSLECVSDVVYADQRHVDGIIHLSPFTCMPEIMSQNIFPSMREDHNIPILALIMDEQTGKAGYVTRIEAFVDLMRRRKRRNLAKQKQQETAAAK